MGLPMNRTILILAEHDQGGLKPITWELATFAFKLREIKPARVMAVIAGRNIDETVQRLSVATGLDVAVLQLPDDVADGPDLYKESIRSVIQQLNPLFFCVGHTACGMDVAPGLAMEMNAACITGIQDIRNQGDRLVFVRPVYNGRMISAVIPETETAVLTVLPGSFGKHVFEPLAPGRIERFSCPCTPPKRRSRGVRKGISGSVHFADARVIVSAGRGVGKEENMHLIHRLAGIFSRSAVGASRLLCDMGWIDRSRQIGITGTSVTPELYIACGISGAIQHVSAMQGAGYVVAINIDPGAPIFNVSDLCIVEDLCVFIPAFLKTYSTRYGGQGGTLL